MSLNTYLYFQILSVEFSLFLAIFAYFIYGFVLKSKSEDKCLEYHRLIDICFSDASIFLTVLLFRMFQMRILNLCISNDAFIINPFISFIEICCMILLLLLYWGFYDYLLTIFFPIYEFVLLTFVCLLGLFLLLKSNNLFVFYLSIEVQSIALYALIALQSNSIYTIEASLKYYIFSVFLTLSLLFGISLLYSKLGTLNFIDLARILSDFNFNSEIGIIKFGLLLISFGLLLKLAIFPFHGWIADVYAGTNLINTCFLAIIPKIIFLVAILKILFIFSAFKSQISLLLGILGTCSIIIGTVLGLYQIKLLRVLAFSAMVNMGYILISLSLQTVEGFVAGFYSMLIYSFSMLGVLIVLSLYKVKLKFIIDLDKIGKVNKLVALVFVTLIVSLAGLPPFAGFCGKFFIFLAIIQRGEYFYAFLLFFSSIAAAVYYLRLIRFMFFSESVTLINVQLIRISTSLTIILIFIFIVHLLLFLFQAPIILFLHNLIIESFFLPEK